MHVAPSFVPSFLVASPPIQVPANWDRVHQLYDEGEYAHSIQALLKFFQPDLPLTFDPARPCFSLRIPHGSIWLEVEVTEEACITRLPFLRTQAASRIPLFRQVAQLNFSPLNLSRVILTEDELSFRFRCALADCQPDKLYAVLREMCLFGDALDDEYIEKFGAEPIEPPPVEPLTEAASTAVWERVQACIKETQAYIQYFEARRKFGYAWDMAMICLLQIEYVANPQGMLRTRLERAVSDLQGSGPLVERLNYGKAFLEELQTYEQAAFFRDLYRVSVFIPYKYQGSPEQIRSTLEEAHQAARKERDSGESAAATLSLYTALLRLSFYYYLPTPIASHLTQALLAAAGQPWSQASELLWEAVSQLLKDEALLHGQEPNVPGFWQRLRGLWA